MRPRLIRAAASTADLPSTRTAEALLRGVQRASPSASITRELWAGVHLSDFDPSQGLEALATRGCVSRYTILPEHAVHAQPGFSLGQEISWIAAPPVGVER